MYLKLIIILWVGATGLIKALADDYLSGSNTMGSIEWVCNHSRNTQLALLHDVVDLALTYERDQEDLAASEGWSVTAGCVFHDHFCLAGPSSDPAGLESATSLVEALCKIAKSASLFHSRGDSSATMWKERLLWSQGGLEPWKDPDAATWYKISTHSPTEALTAADAAGAYLLTDRSTLLMQTASKTIYNSTVFFEPTAVNDVLMNSCYALFSPHSSAQRAADVARLIQYLLSARGQNIVASLGREEVGFPFFARVSDGFAASFLKGGIPREGKWVKAKESTK